MSKWITGKDVARRLNLKDFEIFDYLTSGKLQPYSSVTGKKLKWYDFNRNDHVEAYNQKSFFNDYLFLKSDIESFELAHGTATKQAESIIDTCEAVKLQGSTKPETIAAPQKFPLANTEEYIRSMEVTYVSDTEIKIKVGKNKAKTFDQQTLGFKKANSKIWQVFIKILRDPAHIYHVGKAHGANRNRKKSYDIGQKYLKHISKKFCTFLNTNHQAQLPENFKVHELIPQKKEAPGAYRFKFKITDDITLNKNQYDGLSKTDLIASIEELSERVKELSTYSGEAKERETEKLRTELQAKVVLALEKKWIGRNQANAYLNPPSDTD